MGFAIGAVIIIIVAVYDIARRHPTDDVACTTSLSECFQGKHLNEFSDHQVVGQNEFDDMLDTIHGDLNKKWVFRTPVDPARMFYDTPFFDGNPRFGEKTKPDQTVCIGDNSQCYRQSSINYVAQGMYSARTGEPLWVSKLVANAWNLISYGHFANEEELYWIERGYDTYNKINEEKNGESGQAIKKKPSQATLLME